MLALYIKRTVIALPVKIIGVPLMTTTYIAHCGANDRGFTIEIIAGTHQEIVNTIRDRRLAYGHVDIVNMSSEVDVTTALITYTII